MKNNSATSPTPQLRSVPRSAEPSAKIIHLKSFTAVPDPAWLHVDEWRRLGLHQIACVYTAGAKAASLKRQVNAARLQAIAEHFQLGQLGSLRRVQLALRELIGWDFLRWEDPAALRQRYQSRLLLAGTDYDFEIQGFEYLGKRQEKIRTVKAKERDVARVRVATGLPSLRRRREPLSEWRPTWEAHRDKLIGFWRPLLRANELRSLEDVWCFVARTFEEKGFALQNASTYLARLSSDPDKSGARSPLLIAKSLERIQRYIESNRRRMAPLEKRT